VTEITCDICMDLMPLVRDGIASDDSKNVVMAHLAVCDTCRVMYEEEIPLPDRKSALKIRRRMQFFSAMLLMFGVFFGLSLTAGDNLFYNTIIMPIIGALGYHLFRWRAGIVVPLLLFATHIGSNGLHLLLGIGCLDIREILIWTILYCIFALLGVLIAGLIHFALRKEQKKNDT